VSQTKPHDELAHVAVEFEGAVQGLLQPPQLSGSLLASMQSEPHWVKPASQVTPHLPALQLALPPLGAGQALPHVPQLSTFC